MVYIPNLKCALHSFAYLPPLFPLLSNNLREGCHKIMYTHPSPNCGTTNMDAFCKTDPTFKKGFDDNWHYPNKCSYFRKSCWKLKYENEHKTFSFNDFAKMKIRWIDKNILHKFLEKNIIFNQMATTTSPVLLTGSLM